MYPPPGSYRYNTPKPSRLFPQDEQFTLCEEVVLPWIKRSFVFKAQFWKLILMVVLVITSAHFSTIIMFPNSRESLFLVKDMSHSNNAPRKFAFYKAEFVPNLQSDIIVANRSESSLTGKHHLRIKLNPSTQRTKTKQPMVGSRELNSTNQQLKLCPPIPPNLNGPFKVHLTNIPTLEVLEREALGLRPGGRFKPSECQSRNKVAIIIPFRDRASHLAAFLYNIHPFLQRQQLDYAIFIVEQAGNGVFNRAMLMNIGSIEALKLYPYECFVFHDVDLIPEDDRNLYTCPQQPRHMSVAINTFKYKLPYNDIFGGVSAMTVSQLQTVNGFSNKFWGWGGEDDDMSNRIKYHGFYISRFPANIARYTMISHKKDRPNPQRYKFLSQGRRRFQTDGLNTVKYKCLSIELRPLYTWIKVDLIQV